MPTLSLAMIVKNEEKNLGRCLASVKDLVDEMVIVDTGSTDGTLALAASYGAKVGHFTWNDDFSAARNESLRLCTGDWILVLDADEAVDALDHKKIREACMKSHFSAYFMALRNYFADGGALVLDQLVRPNDKVYAQGSKFDYCADFQGLRLCRRLPGLQFEGRIHELLLPYFQKRNLPTGTLDAVIHHFGKLDVEREAAKAVRYLQQAKAQVASDPANQQYQYSLMTQAAVARDWATTVTAGTAHLALVKRPKTTALILLALGLQEMGRWDEAIPHLNRALAAQEDHPLALSRLVMSLAHLGHVEEAQRRLEGILRLHPQIPYLWKVMADLLLRQNRFAEAVATLKEAVRICPGDADLWDTLIQLEARLGQGAPAAADAWAALRMLPTAGGGDWHILVAAFLLKEGNILESQSVLELGLTHHPTHEGLLRLRALAGDLNPPR